MSEKAPTSFRLTPTAARLLEQISEREGIAKSAVLELLIRRRAEELKFPIPAQEEQSA